MFKLPNFKFTLPEKASQELKIKGPYGAGFIGYIYRNL